MVQNDGVARGTPKRIAVDTSHRKRRSATRKSGGEEALLLSNSRFGSNDSDGRSLDRQSERSRRSSPGRPADKAIHVAGLENATAGRGDSPPSKSSRKRFKEENTPCFKRQMPSNSQSNASPFAGLPADLQTNGKNTNKKPATLTAQLCK